MPESEYSNSSEDYEILMRFSETAKQTMANLQREYTTLETALTNTKTDNYTRRQSLRDQMNTNMSYQKQLTETINAAYDVAATNEAQSRQNFARLLGTISLLDVELENAVTNIAILNQDQINKARMADINTNTSKENNAQMELFKMVSLYLLCVLVLAVLGKFIKPIANITKVICVLVIIAMIFHVINAMMDMSKRSALNYDEYNWTTPSNESTSSTELGWESADTDDDDDDDDSNYFDSNFSDSSGCNTTTTVEAFNAYSDNKIY